MFGTRFRIAFQLSLKQKYVKWYKQFKCYHQTHLKRQIKLTKYG